MSTVQTPWKANLLLLIAALIWGVTFVPQKTAMEHLSPVFFTGLRFLTGCSALYVVILVIRRYSVTQPKKISPIEWKIGAILGCLMFAGMAFQQVSLVYTSVAKVGFITGVSVVLVPILGIFFGQKAGWFVFGCTLITLWGLYLLSIPPEGIESASLFGDSLALIGAVAWASHILTIGYFKGRGSAFHIAFAQFLVTAVLGMIFAFMIETPNWSAVPYVTFELLFCGVVSVSFAFTLQVIAQQSAPAASAAIILSLEAVFAAIAGWLFLNEIITGRSLIGIALIFTAMLATELFPILRRPKTPRSYS